MPRTHRHAGQLRRAREALAFKKLPSQGLLRILRESGVDLVEISSLNRKEPATSFKQKGKGRFHADLLVPSPNETFPTVAVPELKAHATEGSPFIHVIHEFRPAQPSQGMQSQPKRRKPELTV